MTMHHCTPEEWADEAMSVLRRVGDDTRWKKNPRELQAVLITQTFELEQVLGRARDLLDRIPMEWHESQTIRDE